MFKHMTINILLIYIGPIYKYDDDDLMILVNMGGYITMLFLPYIQPYH